MYILALLLSASAAMGQSYRLELREMPAEGKSVIVRRTLRQDVQRQIKDDKGRLLQDDNTATTEIEEHTLAVQVAKGGQATRFTRRYLKAERITGKKKTPRSYQGRKVLFQIMDGKLSALVDTAPPLDAEDRKSLQANGPEPVIATIRALLPSGEISTDKRWTIPLEKVKPLTSGDLIEKDSKASGRLVKVYERDGRRCGKVEIDIDLALDLGRGNSPGRFLAKIRADMVIDGKGTRGAYHTDMTLTGVRKAEVKGKTVTVGGTTRSTLSVEASEEK